MQNKLGTLYVVATPIGNLGDMTLRAIEILKQVDRIAVEDTRHSAPLLKHFSIKKPTFSLHDFNETKQIERLIEHITQGESIALISDAGTPLISDPGYHLIKMAKLQNISVVPIPGACAAVAALCVSGLPTNQFVFEGFLPAKLEAQRQRLQALADETRTLIFYEAPHRLMMVLKTMIEVFGDKREGVIARELTKIHESVIADNLSALLHYYETHPDQQRGEIVILIRGEEEKARVTKAVSPDEVLNILLEELPIKQAATLASKITGERKNVLYDMALMKKGKKEG